MNTTFAPLNQEVTVNSFYFTSQAPNRQPAHQPVLKSYPRQIELDGQNVTFIESGLRLLLKSGQRLAQLFDMSASDGRTYRLRLEDSHWTLIGISGGAR